MRSLRDAPRSIAVVIGLLVTLAMRTAPTTVNSRQSGRRDAAPALWGGLIPGAYRVGYERLDIATGVVHAWYPATTAGPPLALGDYLGESRARLTASLTGAGVAAATTEGLLASPLYASSGARRIDRVFPIIVVAQGNGEDVVDQVVLCEYLASQGFVVTTTPSPMLRMPLTSEDQVGTLAEMQATDMTAAIAAVATAMRGDRKRVGLVGHSFGARSALLLAMRDRRVRALVSLDGGIGTATAAEAYRRAPSFRSDATLPPILHFYETLDAFMTPDFGLLKSLHTSELRLVPTEGMHHAHFTTYGSAATGFADLARLTEATPATAGAVRDVAERTAAFLRERLR